MRVECFGNECSCFRFKLCPPRTTKSIVALVFLMVADVKGPLLRVGDKVRVAGASERAIEPARLVEVRRIFGIRGHLRVGTGDT